MSIIARPVRRLAKNEMRCQKGIPKQSGPVLLVAFHLLRFPSIGGIHEDRRQELEKGAEVGQSNGDNEGPMLDFDPPLGESAAEYLFGDPEVSGDGMILDFEPADGGTENRVRGRPAWRKRGLEPLWAEFFVVAPPKPLKRMSVRLEYERVGDEIFVTRMVTRGLAQALLMKREFHLDLEWRNIRPVGAS